MKAPQYIPQTKGALTDAWQTQKLIAQKAGLTEMETVMCLHFLESKGLACAKLIGLYLCWRMTDSALAVWP